ncbi:MAG: DUF134 domain-containing protein [Pseudomonadota bacterium]
MRPSKARQIHCRFQHKHFRAYGNDAAQDIIIGHDLMEALRLVDAEGASQDAAAQSMDVSTATLCRILGQARQHVATALCNGHNIIIEGGNVKYAQEQGRHRNGMGNGCGHGRGNGQNNGQGNGMGRGQGMGNGRGNGCGCASTSDADQVHVEGQTECCGLGRGNGRGQGNGQGHGQGNGQGRGRGMGNGMGRGNGQCNGKGMGRAAQADAPVENVDNPAEAEG